LSDYLLLECSNREEYDCKLALEKYSLKKCEEQSINLELAIGNGTTKTMHELTNAIIKNKKLDKIAVIEIIFEFIKIIIDNYTLSIQRGIKHSK